MERVDDEEKQREEKNGGKGREKMEQDNGGKVEEKEEEVEYVEIGTNPTPTDLMLPYEGSFLPASVSGVLFGPLVIIPH